MNEIYLGYCNLLEFIGFFVQSNTQMAGNDKD